MISSVCTERSERPKLGQQESTLRREHQKPMRFERQLRFTIALVARVNGHKRPSTPLNRSLHHPPRQPRLLRPARQSETDRPRPLRWRLFLVVIVFVAVVMPAAALPGLMVLQNNPLTSKVVSKLFKFPFLPQRRVCFPHLTMLKSNNLNPPPYESPLASDRAIKDNPLGISCTITHPTLPRRRFLPGRTGSTLCL